MRLMSNFPWLAYRSREARVWLLARRQVVRLGAPRLIPGGSVDILQHLASEKARVVWTF